MSIRNLNLLLRFAILALLAGFSSVSLATAGWNTNYGETGKCFLSISDACVNNDAVAWSAAVAGGQLAKNNGLYSGNQCLMAYGATYQNSSTFSPNSCDSACSAGQSRLAGVCTSTPTCSAGKEYSSFTGECEWITSCPSGQALFTTKTSGGVTASASCVPQISTPNQKCISYDDLQTSYCQQQSATCSSSGGTFGNINGNNVCIPAGNNLPTCASGGTQFVTNGDGSSSAVCVGTPNLAGAGTNTGLPAGVTGGATSGITQAQANANISNNTAEIARINAAGFQSLVNAMNNNTSKTVAAGGGSGTGSTASQDQSNAQGVIDAINANTSSEHGAGACDPHAANYQSCIAPAGTDPDAGPARDAAKTQGDAIIDGIGDDTVAGINDAATQAVPSTSGFMATFQGLLPQSESCADYSTTFHGVSFRVTCGETTIYREWAAWATALMTIYAIFEIMVRRPT